MRPTYSPSTPMQNSWIPPSSATTAINQGQPRPRHRGARVDEPVVALARQELEARLAGTAEPHAVDDLEPLLPPLDHLGDDFGRILQIGVDHHHRVSARVVDARAQRNLVP